MMTPRELHEFFHTVFPERMERMSAHKHANECEHEVTVCRKCDIAYCSKCSKEWGAPCNLTHFYYPWYPTQTTTSTGIQGFGDSANPICVHG